MTSGWGVDATKVGGVPTSGTTDLDVRKVWGALYTPGIITGARVTTSASEMKYTISSGVVAIRTATGEVVMAPVQGATISTPAAPSSGERRDIVWARQRFPTIDGNSDVVLEVGQTLPARAVALQKFRVLAGQTNTNAAIEDGNLEFSIPYGASLGVLYRWQDKTSRDLTTQKSPPVRAGNGSFFLPTDRRVKFSYSNTIHASGNAIGFDNSKYCEMAFIPSLDGGDFVQWTTNGLHQAWQTVYYETTIDVSAGQHTCNIGMYRVIGPGSARQEAGVFDGYGREGAIFQVEDVGPIK